MTNLKDTLANITRAIVDKPEEIIIVEKEDGEHVTLELSVSPSDMGKVIGKQGKIAKAMRTIVRAATPASSKRYVIEICERGGETVNVDTSEDAE
jgi:predicted RNA-binding protein YlqC (UPF0109 family)